MSLTVTLVKMLVLTVLSLAVMTEGYRIISAPPQEPMGINMMRTMCIQNGANYTAFGIAASQFVNCMEVDFGVKMLETEFKEAYNIRTYEALNKVFKKYCRKMPEIKTCYHKLVDVAAPCFGHEKQDLVKLTNNVNDQVLDYMCENDGSIITEFIMEGGQQCFQEKTYDIMICSEIAKSSLLIMAQSSTLSTSASHRTFDDLLKCVTQSVESCQNSISSRVVNRVGEIVRQSINKDPINVSAGVSTDEAA